MLPSILSEKIRKSLINFVSTGFETQTPLFEGMFTEFAKEHGKLYKGAYLSIDLPFLKGDQGGSDNTDYFPTLRTSFPPYYHQEQAWLRISSDKQGLSTIVATGTGSGKTECFLYPVLDHCARSSEKGIKTIIIYPMNALATDQSKRFADAIYSNPELRGKLRVGLFVGGDDEGQSTKMMTPNQVITDKHSLRSNPPDILLTNYKMLDFLLMRPKDQQLWQHNSAETLKYLIVDELHTFDGAQGTDLSCLIRRMKARLQTPEKHLICVGTSATLGDASSINGLTDFASKVFQDQFEEVSVIGETRLSSAEFIGNELLSYGFFPVDDFSVRVNAENYQAEADYLRAQFQLLFAGETIKDIHDPAWRQDLGKKLKKHQLFYNLLQLLTEPAFPFQDLVKEFAKLLPPDTSEETLEHLINALCALISWARSSDNPQLPLVSLRVQLWVRELRRMVAPIKQNKLEEEGNYEHDKPIELTFFDDLEQSGDAIHLPLVQCTQCHATAWAGVKPKEQNALKTDLRLIYNAFFGHSPELLMLFPIDDDFKEPAVIKGFKSYLCGDCGSLQMSESECHACGFDHLTYVYQPINIKERKVQGTPRLVSEHHCPMCLSQHSMMVFGARSASLSSVAIHQSYATPFNDDKKLITFSDNVQDAAHRAGFFAARTWQQNTRMAIAQAIPDDTTLSLEDFYQRLPAYWLDRSLNAKAFDDVHYISEFLAPNMLYYTDYLALTEDGVLPKDSGLVKEINKRFEWEVLAEFGYRGSIGRSLQRTGTAALGIELEPIDLAVKALLPRLSEELGLQHLETPSVRYFVVGFLLYLKQRGAIYHPFLEGYIHSGGNNFLLNKFSYLPAFATQTTSPTFVCNKNQHASFDCLISKKGSSWYQNWCSKTLLGGDKIELSSQNIEADIYQLTLPLLVEQGLLLANESSGASVWGLNPKKLYLSKDLVNLTTQQQPTFYIPAMMASVVEGMPSLITNDQEKLSITNTESHWLQPLYNQGEIHRVIAHEHTGLLGRKKREAVENDFMQGDKPWSLNLLSATPTLEMGIDIGDLSSVLLCSVPPAQANYLQRIGRAGRRDGNAFNFTVAQGAPHDLHFYADPKEMMTGSVEAPDVYLNASAVISRQLTAFCFDNWVATGLDGSAIPRRMSQVLNTVERGDLKSFPYNFLHYVNQRADDLLARFLGLFDDHLNDHTRQYLADFLLGAISTETHTDHQKTPQSLGFENNLIQFLFEGVKERSSLKDRIDELRKHLKKLAKRPEDEAVNREISEVQIEREGLQAILRQINGKQVLNFFTDEGLLPNYAFPESGVTLRSVIFRKKKEVSEDGKQFENDVFEYERAASSALSELAPENTFYAGGRKVKIQQIDLKLSELESWRFCPRCNYSQLDRVEVAPACPRCSDPMWFDNGQRVQMIRLRQVMANTSDRESRMGDDSDDREPVFYTKQLLPDFEPGQVESAYKLESETFPFGFEFIRKVDFREINFGAYGASQEESLIGGESLARPGFRLCKHCGMVHTKDPKEKKHSFACSGKDQEDDDVFVDCLYLYREFTSEALRILLPVYNPEGTERYLNSFIAALQLGLKQKFGGKVDHLRAMSYSAPIPDSDVRQHFLMLYDSVPGGTGYLQDLMSKPEDLMSLFRKARDVMATCDCNHSDHDGCYQCLYAYRNSHGMESTSRTLAVELFSNILDLEEKLVAIDGIDDIAINPVMDSELEARFIEAIRRFGHGRGSAGVNGGEQWVLQIHPQIVQGKPGYYLRIGKREYLIEPQVTLNDSDGVAIASKPDFMIRSTKSEDGFLPVAIFMDGYEYHKSTVTEDSLKRLAIVESGQFYQWSLTWADVNEQFAKNQTATKNPFIENQNEVLGDVKKQLTAAFDIASLRQLPMKSPMEQLMAYLKAPEPEQWQKMIFAHGLGWFDAKMQDEKANKGRFECFKHYAPVELRERFEEDQKHSFYGGIVGTVDSEASEKSNNPLSIVCKVHGQAIQQLDPELASFNVLLDTVSGMDNEEAFKLAWHGFLRVYNLFQFLPRSGFYTSDGGEAGVYEALQWRDTIKTVEIPVNADGDESALVALIAEALEEFHESLHKLVEKKLPLPEVCYELQDSVGEIIAEAEFYWDELKVVGLLDSQVDYADLFQQAGWEVLELDDGVEWLGLFEKLVK